MFSLEQIESDLKESMKNRDQIATDALRGLKTRIQNEKIAKMKDLTDEDFVALIRSEIKKRREAAESFASAGRSEQAEKENKEAVIFEKYLPAQLSEEEIGKLVDEVITANDFTSKDFGQAMKAVKTKAGAGAEGGTLAKILKEKLK